MIIRELQSSDSDGLSDCYASYYDERKDNPNFGLTLRPEKPSIGEGQEWFSKFYQGILEGNNVGMVVEEGLHIIGFCEIQRIGIKSEVSHRADLGISVRKGYRGKGVGTALLSETLKKCKNKFEIIELSVFSTNEVAKRLYEKAGFKIFGLRLRSIKRGDIYIDEYLMSLAL